MSYNSARTQYFFTLRSSARLYLTLTLVVITTLIVFRAYLVHLSENNVRSFRTQNLTDLSSGDTLSLSRKLSLLRSTEGLVCAIGSKDGTEFFKETDGPCGTSIFRHRVEIDQSKTNGLEIQLTYSFSFEVRLVAGLLIFLQIIFFQAITIFSRKLEREKNLRAIEISDLARSVAHDLRSPMTALNVAVTHLLRKENSEESNLIKLALERIRTIADELLSIKMNQNVGSDKPDIAPSVTVSRFKTIVTELCEMKKREWSRSSDIKSISLFDNLPDKGTVCVSEPDCLRVLSNLINNAMEAIDGQGTVGLTLSKELAHIRVEIRDTGKGIPIAIKNRLLKEPISYLKKGGSGLGLWTAQKKISQWGGELEIESELNVGTSVVMRLVWHPENSAIAPPVKSFDS